jgi:hypothetical protein
MNNMPRIILLMFLVGSTFTVAAAPVAEMSCADYLGGGMKGDQEEKSASYMAGLKLGISLRQATMASWVHGYLEGYHAVEKKDQHQGIDINTLKSKMRLHCDSNREQTMRELAEAFSAL